MNAVYKNKNDHLRSKNRYYIAGWCDGEHSADIIMRENSSEYQDYLAGYADAKDNNEYLMNTFGEITWIYKN